MPGRAVFDEMLKGKQDNSRAIGYIEGVCCPLNKREIMPGTGNLANFPGIMRLWTLEKNLTPATLLDQRNSNFILNLILSPQRSVAITLHQRCSSHSKWKPSQKSTTGNSAKTNGLRGAQPQWIMYAAQFLHLWTRQHHRKGGQKGCKRQNTRKSARSLPLLHANSEGRKSQGSHSQTKNFRQLMTAEREN